MCVARPAEFILIELEGLDWQKLEREPSAARPAPATSPAVLTIAQAKAGLAANYGVGVDAIEIIIRG